MEILERRLEEFIFDDLLNNDGDYLASNGFRLSHHFLCTYQPKMKWIRQLDLGSYGRLDLVGFFRYKGVLHFELMELKKGAIDSNHFDQIFRYKTGLERYIKRLRPGLRIECWAYLIGAEIKNGHYIQNNLYGLDLIEYSDEFGNLKFKKHSCQTHWGMKNDESFDVTKLLRHA